MPSSERLQPDERPNAHSSFHHSWSRPQQDVRREIPWLLIDSSNNCDKSSFGRRPRLRISPGAPTDFCRWRQPPATNVEHPARRATQVRWPRQTCIGLRPLSFRFWFRWLTPPARDLQLCRSAEEFCGGWHFQFQFGLRLLGILVLAGRIVASAFGCCRSGLASLGYVRHARR